MSPFIQWIKYQSLTETYGIYVLLTINSPNKIGLRIHPIRISTHSCYSYLYFHSLKVSILTIDCKAYQPSLAVYNVYSSFIPPIFQNYVEDHSCIFALTDVSEAGSHRRFYHFYLGTAMNGSVQSSQTVIGIDVLCITSCPLRNYINYNSLTYQCIPCSRNCLTCIESFICTKCQDQSLLANRTCHLCSSLMSNCSTCHDTNFCTKCFVGFLVGGLCTSIKGCTLLMAYQNGTTPGTYCLGCN